VVVAEYTASETNAIIGIYGTSGNYELGGLINADGADGDNLLSCSIATQQ
jgi:hypothetical protein